MNNICNHIHFFVEIYLSPAGQKEANNDGRWNTGRCTYFWLHNFNTEIRVLHHLILWNIAQSRTDDIMPYVYIKIYFCKRLFFSLLVHPAKIGYQFTLGGGGGIVIQGKWSQWLLNTTKNKISTGPMHLYGAKKDINFTIFNCYH